MTKYIKGIAEMNELMAELLGILGAVIVLMLGGLWQAMWSMKKDLRSDIKERHEILHAKINSYCVENHADHAEIKKRVEKHKHDKETGEPVFYGA